MLERLEREDEKEVCLKSEIERERDFPKCLTFFWTCLAPLLDHTRRDHCNLIEMRNPNSNFLHVSEHVNPCSLNCAEHARRTPGSHEM